MEAFFLIIHVLLAVALIGIVLIQRSSTDGFGLGSGSGAGFMTGRQAANLLTRSTAIIATLFIVNSLWLGWIATHKDKTSLTDQIEAVMSKKDATKDSASKEKADEKVGKPATDEKSGDKKSDAKKTGDAKADKSDDEKPKKPEPKADEKAKDAPAVPVAE